MVQCADPEKSCHARGELGSRPSSEQFSVDRTTVAAKGEAVEMSIIARFMVFRSVPFSGQVGRITPVPKIRGR